jgi:hypothetical protein
LQGRYKGILVDRDAYLLDLSRYLHLNPVRAKIVERPEDYRQSSYGTYVKGKKDAMVTTDLLLGMLSEDGRMARKAYREYVDAGMGEGVRNPFAEVYGGVILGSRGFIKEALGRVKEAALDQAEIAQRRELHKLRSEDVIDALCSHFGVPADRFGEWGTALRDISDLSSQTPHLRHEPADRGPFSRVELFWRIQGESPVLCANVTRQGLINRPIIETTLGSIPCCFALEV